MLRGKSVSIAVAVTVSFLASAGAQAQLPTITPQMLVALDTNHDGALDLAEVQAAFPFVNQAMFDQLDQNGDGVLTLDDFGGAPPDPLAVLRQLLSAADANGDGVVTYQEAVAVIPALPQHVFDAADTNNDGVLSAADLPQAPPSALDTLLHLLNQVDTDGDGQITLEEVLAVIPDFPEDWFDVLDYNEDGVLSLDDLPAGPVPIDVVLRLFRLADLDEDGVVTFDELQAVIPALTQEQFDFLDRNGDGVLSPEDLPAPPPEDPVARLLRLLREADADGDGLVTLDEIRILLADFPEEAFIRLDLNDDGVLSLADLPHLPPAAFRELLLRLLRQADADNNGEVTFDELLAVVPELTQDHFDRLDRNDDGVLSRDDLPPFPNDPIDRLLRLLREADVNGDAQVTFEELLAVLPNLTQEQFDWLDKNGDGVLSLDDLPAPPRNVLERLIALLHQADADDNGEVTFDELQAVYPELTQDQFDALDRNGDGVISRDDLPEPPEDPRERLLRLLREADADDNGEVTFDELQTVLPELTQEQFDRLDRNGDGVISRDDLPDSAVPEESTRRREFLQRLINADTNGNGVLEYDEIAAAFPDAPAELLAEIDANGDWVITREELMAVLGLTTDGAALVPKNDANADGSVNAIDVQVIVNNALGIPGEVLLPDMNGDGVVDAIDLQLVIISALGLD